MSERLPYYSGDASVEFWKAVNATDDLTLYNFACALQDLEGRVLASLENAQRGIRLTRTAKPVRRQPATSLDVIGTSGGKATVETKR